MKTKRVSNIRARQEVNNLQDFQGSNLFAETIHGIYVVYSFGHHFPMYAHLNGKWFGNCSKYSISTSKHQSQTKPNATIEYVNTIYLKILINQQITKRHEREVTK